MRSCRIRAGPKPNMTVVRRRKGGDRETHVMTEAATAASQGQSLLAPSGNQGRGREHTASLEPPEGTALC
jgi:hypothetical protein